MKAMIVALSLVVSSVAYAQCTSTFITGPGGKTTVCIACADSQTVICN